MKHFFKKFHAVLIVGALLLSTIPFYVFASSNDMKIWVAADTHLKPHEVSGDLEGGDGMYYYAPIQGQMNYESTAIVKSFLKSFSSSGDKILLIAGDLTDGRRKSHEAMKQLLASAEKKGKRIFVICGNHDVDDGTRSEYTTADEFKKIYNDFGYSEALATDSGSLSYTAELSGEYRLIAIDSCIYGKDNGKIDVRLQKWIKAQADAAKSDGKRLVAMVHHSILPHLSASSVLSSSFLDCNYMDVAEVLADMGIKYVFTGHLHANDITESETDSGSKIYDVLTGSLITYPNAYRTVSFAQDKVEISTKYVTSIKDSDLVGGYTAKQLSLLKSDFQAYSKGYFDAGIENWVKRYIGSAYKVAKLLNIKEGTALYDSLDGIMAVLGDALALPLYDKGTAEVDSVEEIAKSAGVTLQKSKYTTVYQLACEVMRNFYCGDEKLTMQSPVAVLLFDSLRACVSYAAGAYSEKMICADSLKATGFFAKLAFSDTISKEIITILVTPLLESLLTDPYSPGDLNVTLEAYGKSSVPPKNGASFKGTDIISQYFTKVQQGFNAAFN